MTLSFDQSHEKGNALVSHKMLAYTSVYKLKKNK